ncbi:hypothetical protein [Janthinobacterium sp. PC23-8]|uniref:hypothetical protein n=1 Tax=Janthinobacterium sp. PC23-8 TaxID=2012679 RepID=UPI0011403831|nr:hypothetical protein [Janthinobacterium sp. PC23-8]
MIKLTIAATVTLLLCGCASTTGTFFNRPVVEDSLDKRPGVLSLSADRRTVLFVDPPSAGVPGVKFCAEPPPDTANGIAAALNGSIESTGKGKIAVDDKFTTTVTVLAARTASLDAYRTGVYALCQYHLNGAVSSAEVSALFKHLTDAFVQVQLAEQKTKDGASK